MKPSEALQANREIIRRVVAAHHASNPRIFGSVLHGDDTENSDLDILVDPTPDHTVYQAAPGPQGRLPGRNCLPPWLAYGGATARAGRAAAKDPYLLNLMKEAR